MMRSKLNLGDKEKLGIFFHQVFSFCFFVLFSSHQFLCLVLKCIWYVVLCMYVHRDLQKSMNQREEGGDNDSTEPLTLWDSFYKIVSSFFFLLISLNNYIWDILTRYKGLKQHFWTFFRLSTGPCHLDNRIFFFQKCWF